MNSLNDVLENEIKLYQNDIRKVYRELRKYTSLEEELGISLPILFKALKNGIWFIYDKDEKDFTKRPRLYYSDDFKCYCFEICFGAWVVKLKDYGKTWWLKEDLKSE